MNFGAEIMNYFIIDKKWSQYGFTGCVSDLIFDNGFILLQR